MRRALALFAALLEMGAAPVMPRLASHRAVYDISLERDTGDVVGARGRLAIEFRDLCDGWSTAQRIVTDVTGSDGSINRSDFFVTAWESRDGRTMRFDVSDVRNGKVRSRQRGVATLAGDGSGRVDLLHGKPGYFMLPRGTEFPTSQILGILRTASARRGTYRHLVFQGGDPTDLTFSTALVGAQVNDAALSGDRAADRNGLLRHERAVSALISFFPLDKHQEQPDYQVSAHLFANGINGTMSLIYPHYTLKATLTRLEALKAPC